MQWPSWFRHRTLRGPGFVPRFSDIEPPTPPTPPTSFLPSLALDNLVFIFRWEIWVRLRSAYACSDKQTERTQRTDSPATGSSSRRLLLFCDRRELANVTHELLVINFHCNAGNSLRAARPPPCRPCVVEIQVIFN